METDSHIGFFIFFAAAISLLIIFYRCETALRKLSEINRHERFLTDTAHHARLQRLLENPVRLLASLRVAIVFFSIAIVIAAVEWAQYYTQSGSVIVPLVMIVVLTAMFLLVQQVWLPRTALKGRLELIRRLSLPLTMYYHAVSPIVTLFEKLRNGLGSKADYDNEAVDEERILALAEDAGERDLYEEERQLIHSIIEFGDTEVHDVMVPRTDMVCVEENSELSDLAKIILENGHSRIPLYREDVDHILGVIHVKDFWPYSSDAKEKLPNLQELARPAYFVPQTKKISELLRELQRKKLHMAIVVDEYGGTSGLVTLEDILEEIVGDIQDEYDRELPLYKKLDEHTYTVDAKIDLHELNDVLNINLPTEGEYDSLGGFILSLTGYVPQEQEIVEHDACVFAIEEIDRNRIVRVKISINGEPERTEQTEK